MKCIFETRVFYSDQMGISPQIFDGFFNSAIFGRDGSTRSVGGNRIGEMQSVVPECTMMATRSSHGDPSVCLKFWKNNRAAWSSSIDEASADFVVQYISGADNPDLEFQTSQLPFVRLTNRIATGMCDEVAEALKNEIMLFRLAMTNIAA